MVDENWTIGRYGDAQLERGGAVSLPPRQTSTLKWSTRFLPDPSYGAASGLAASSIGAAGGRCLVGPLFVCVLSFDDAGDCESFLSLQMLTIGFLRQMLDAR